MKIIFIGASEFGFECIESIIQLEGIEIVGIVSNEQNFSISYNKEGVQNLLYKDFGELANNNAIPFYRMKENMKEEGLAFFLKSCKPDQIIVIGWYHMITPKLLSQYVFTGIHASLLPDYSGGAPLVWAIINGEEKTGVTYFYFDEGVDSGDIIAQEEIEIGNSNTIKEVYKKAEFAAKSLIIKYLPLLAIGKAPRIKQDSSKRRIFPQRKPSDGEIDWNWDSRRIKNFIRAQTRPYPGAFTIINGKKITIWDSSVEDL